MPYWRLMYDWDNNYTKKEKRMILLTQEAIDKINGLTPGGWAEYTAGSWIAISSQNVISNTAQFSPTNAWTTWQVLKKVGNSYSWANAEWWAMFVTQEEYDALPSSKLTDGIEYIIVDTHCELMTYPELFQLEINNNANTVLTELNSCADWYRKKLSNNWVAYIQDGSDYGTLPSWKHLYWYFMYLSNSNHRYVSYDTDMTAQELGSLFTWASAQMLQSIADWERLYSGGTPIEMRWMFLSDNEVEDGNK